MEDLIEAVKGGFRDLAKGLGGIEVLNDGLVHLKITDPKILLEMIRVDDNKEIEKTPLRFSNAIDVGNPAFESVFPWLNGSMIKHLTGNKDVLMRPKYVSFLYASPSNVGSYISKRRKELEQAGFNLKV